MDRERNNRRRVLRLMICATAGFNVGAVLRALFITGDTDFALPFVSAAALICAYIELLEIEASQK